MWRTLRTKYNLVVSQEVTRDMLRQIDPVNVENRRRHRLTRRTYTSKGPNDTWHLDGYDKLRPYGFLISGCIDGYSRRIMWLKCAYTNHDPAVIGGYFLETAARYGGFPETVRTDCGTENVVVAAIQEFVVPRRRSHVYGSSPHNQRIEAWWSFYRRNRSQWWIDLFEDLVDLGVFHPGHMKEVDLLRYCFMQTLRSDLVEVAAMWNVHRIRPSVGARCPPGIPDELYFLPLRGAVDCKVPTQLHNLPAFLVQQTHSVGTCEDGLFEEYLDYVCNLSNFSDPTTPDECSALYLKLHALVITM